ncbi:TetR/AcrR family transcriptional regulator [Streptomyces sp. 1331.2]|uniref:TetR/AcrR family transcriptional regulator n=1 Tax=Streptomyces sp. 1331.2 TaxID=1938835 RepID=UPI000BC9F426|nr:TetR/AcrR family transcriptional regulator [Streptomyces sp. 1331.2]SOB88707.1 transcriptional regulator, TetR family [Streptomyces sp. 1331.2]
MHQTPTTGDRQDTAGRPRRGLAEKRQAITRAARTVFGRDGYTRASIDAIATEAGVSTRTIYNHFAGKELLFQTVVQESATQVGDAQLDIIDRRLGKVTDLEADLTAFALAWVAPLTEFADHFGLVRQINAEARHLPKAALDAWQEAGPRRVFAALARRFAELAEEGWLQAPDPGRAATHFVLLTATDVTQRSYWGAYPLDAAETEEIVTAGVQAFLRAYAPSKR